MQHNEHNDIQHHDIQHNDIQHNCIQHNDTRVDGLKCNIYNWNEKRMKSKNLFNLKTKQFIPKIALMIKSKPSEYTLTEAYEMTKTLYKYGGIKGFSLKDLFIGTQSSCSSASFKQNIFYFHSSFRPLCWWWPNHYSQWYVSQRP